MSDSLKAILLLNGSDDSGEVSAPWQGIPALVHREPYLKNVNESVFMYVGWDGKTLPLHTEQANTALSAKAVSVDVSENGEEKAITINSSGINIPALSKNKMITVGNDATLTFASGVPELNNFNIKSELITSNSDTTSKISGFNITDVRVMTLTNGVSYGTADPSTIKNPTVGQIYIKVSSN